MYINTVYSILYTVRLKVTSYIVQKRKRFLLPSHVHARLFPCIVHEIIRPYHEIIQSFVRPQKGEGGESYNKPRVIHLVS